MMASPIMALALLAAGTSLSPDEASQGQAQSAPEQKGTGQKPLWHDFYNDPRTEAVPKDVRRFIIKAQGCGHFGGEAGDGNPPERIAYIEKMTDKLCTGLGDKRRKLLSKYAGNTAVQTIISDIWDGYSFDE